MQSTHAVQDAIEERLALLQVLVDVAQLSCQLIVPARDLSLQGQRTTSDVVQRSRQMGEARNHLPA